MKAIMYGAGSIGRGFIGALLSEIGYEVVFIDVNDQVIETINTEGKYPQIIMNETKDIHWITNIRAVDGKDAEAVSNEIADADILATAVGASILERVTPIIAQGLIKRWEKDPSNAINLLICENLMDADVLLKKYLLEALPERYHSIMEQQLGLVETSIGRMVPPADPSVISDQDHPLTVRVEPYDFLPIDQAAFKGPMLEYEKIIPYEPFHYYLERKLYIHNMAHVTTAFLGQFLGYTYIDEAANNIAIQKIVQGCMTESALMLSKKYKENYLPLQHHMDDLIFRFQNPYLKDTIERVAREPIRKLQPSDRLVGAARSCEKMGIEPIYLSFAIGLALFFQRPENIFDFLSKVCKIEKDERLCERILYFYHLLLNTDSLDDVVAHLIRMQASIRGSII